MHCSVYGQVGQKLLHLTPDAFLMASHLHFLKLDDFLVLPPHEEVAKNLSSFVCCIENSPFCDCLLYEFTELVILAS